MRKNYRYAFSDSYYQNIYDKLVPELKFLTKEYFEELFIEKGLKAACYEIDIIDINNDFKNGKREFEFFSNQYKLAFYIQNEKKFQFEIAPSSKFFINFTLDYRIRNLKTLI